MTPFIVKEDAVIGVEWNPLADFTSQKRVHGQVHGFTEDIPKCRLNRCDGRGPILSVFPLRSHGPGGREKGLDGDGIGAYDAFA